MKPAFWVSNISNRNVSLADLNLTIRAMTSVNLLDVRHYSYTLQQLLTSAQSGSLFNKKDKIVIRQVAPQYKKAVIAFNKEGIIPSRERSVLSIKEEIYEELNISDEDFAKANADLADLDTVKQIIVKG